MTELDLKAISDRYARALDAHPSKGDYTDKGIAALQDSVCDIPSLLAFVREVLALADQWERDAYALRHEDNLPDYATCTAIDAKALRDLAARTLGGAS